MKYLVHFSTEKDRLFEKPDAIFVFLARDADEAKRRARKEARKSGFKWYLLFAMVGDHAIPIHQGDVWT